MSVRTTLALALAMTAAGAQAVDFYAAGLGSAPKFTWGGGGATKTAKVVDGAYVVDGLPLTVPKSGNFSWDFYAAASPGATLTSATITFNLSPGAGARWASTTAAKYAAPGGEYSVPSRVVGLTGLGSTAVQTIDLSPYGKSTWHVFATDTFVLPKGVTITSISARVTEAVPEPASLAALGVGALGLLRRRRR